MAERRQARAQAYGLLECLDRACRVAYVMRGHKVALASVEAVAHMPSAIAHLKEQGFRSIYPEPEAAAREEVYLCLWHCAFLRNRTPIQER